MCSAQAWAGMSSPSPRPTDCHPTDLCLSLLTWQLWQLHGPLSRSAAQVGSISLSTVQAVVGLLLHRAERGPAEAHLGWYMPMAHLLFSTTKMQGSLYRDAMFMHS